MTGPTREARELRAKFAKEVDSRIQRLQQLDVEWEQIVQICEETARQLLGEAGKQDPRPWFKGREQELREMENEVAKQREMLRQAKINHNNHQ